MNRRHFINSILGAAATTYSVALLPPVLRPIERSFIFFQGGPKWAPNPCAVEMVGILVAMRSDGEYFYVRKAVAAREFTKERIEIENQALRIGIDRFRNCACTHRQPCAKHDMSWVDEVAA